METSAEIVSEMNNVDACSELPSKEGPLEVEIVKSPESAENINSAPERTQSNEKSSAGDKELSWQKIAAEFTEDEEDDVKPDERASNPQPETSSTSTPETSANRADDSDIVENVVETVQNETVEETVQSDTIEGTIQSETVEEIVQHETVEETIQNKTVEDAEVVETVIVNENVTKSDSSENIVETVRVQITNEHVDEVVEEMLIKDPLESCNENVEASSPKTTEDSVDEALEIIEDSSKPMSAAIEETVKERPTKASVEEVVEEENRVEEVEITELKPEETPVVTETVDDDVEYTVVDADEVETNEIIEEHIAQTHANTETVVIINPDQSQTEITIEQVDENDKNDDDSQHYSEEVYLVTKDGEAIVDDPADEAEHELRDIKPKKQRGRKPISDIPLHVLGRDITKPTEGVSNGGRSMPKPRLGVKVPYRNLTSQIVSKEEIEKEIMERFKLKQEQNATNSGDILFARKLTQRLAKKLIPTEREKVAQKSSESTTSVVITKEPQTESEIKNNSDLIAILEGEGDDIQLPKHSEQPKESIINKNTEKEIALQQLKELPVAKSKFYKSRPEEEKKPVIQVVKPPVKTPPAEWSPPKNPGEKKNQSEMEPRLKTGMVIKTYTRKRKSTDLETLLPPKKSVVVAATIKSEDGPPTNVYITKSSRVIKRKVIWDPDEVPTKSPIKSPKAEVTTVKSPVKSPKPEVTTAKIPVKSPKPEVTVAKTPVKSPKSETSVAKPVEKTMEKKIPVPIKKMVSKSPPPKKLKRLTEVDKLLMDEGAVNMLYDVKTNDDTSQEKLKKKNNNKSVISLDRAHKELMSKTNVIKNDLQQNSNKDNQKSLRKKEISTPSPPKKEIPPPKKEAAPATTTTRKKSKDSARSSVHSPPASPPYNAAEASRIIRRHSSSSFSSTDDINEENGEERVTRKRSSATIESPKKKMKKSVDAKPTKEVTKNNNNTVTEGKDKNSIQYKTFTVTKKNKLVSIKLNTVNSKHYFTDQVLKELTICLKDLSKDDECHVASLTSDSNDSFCHGLDYRSLVADDENARKKRATELSSLVKEFLRCLLNFPKVLVAGIQGDCVGLGVTMLPLFDMVIASDTSTFSTPYAKLGCVPEAGFLLTVPHLGSQGLASELLYTSQVIKADDAFRRGLVTRLCWPEKYHEELKGMLTSVASQPKQTIMATKQQLRQHVLQTTESSLNSSIKVLVEQWTSSECQKNFLK